MSEQAKSNSIFRMEGDVFVPTGLARGPWYPNSQHGSAMLGLLARAVELHPSEREMMLTRCTVDMMKAAPMSAVRTEVRVVRKGKNVEVLEASLMSEGTEFARAHAMRFPLNPVPVPEHHSSSHPELRLPDPPQGDDGLDFSQDDDDEDAFHHALEIRPVPGFELPVFWVRMLVPLVEGEVLTPVVRTAVACDFTYSMPIMRTMMRDPESLMSDNYTSINPDTGFNLHRPLQGEWVGLHCHVFYGNVGAGSAFAQIHDEEGVVGTTSQTLFVSSREQKPRLWEEREVSRQR
jgi:hypothetical protein